MKYLKTYNQINESDEFESNRDEIKSFFENKINWDLINDLKDLSLEFIDEGCRLYYSAIVDGYYIITGSFFSKFDKIPSDISQLEMDVIMRFQNLEKKDSYLWSDFKDEYLERTIQSWNDKHEIKYLISLTHRKMRYEDYTTNNIEGEDEILERIRYMYPNEKIEISRR